MSAKSWVPSEKDYQSVRGSIGNFAITATQCGSRCTVCSCSCTACNSCRCTPCHRSSGTRISLRR